MKTAVSIPEDVFRHADRVADQRGWSRSQPDARALEEFLTQHEGDPVTEALDVLAAAPGNVELEQGAAGLDRASVVNVSETFGGRSRTPG